jgi:hypothetical protein
VTRVRELGIGVLAGAARVAERRHPSAELVEVDDDRDA